MYSKLLANVFNAKPTGKTAPLVIVRRRTVCESHSTSPPGGVLKLSTQNHDENVMPEAGGNNLSPEHKESGM